MLTDELSRITFSQQRPTHLNHPRAVPSGTWLISNLGRMTAFRIWQLEARGELKPLFALLTLQNPPHRDLGTKCAYHDERNKGPRGWICRGDELSTLLTDNLPLSGNLSVASRDITQACARKP